MRVGGIVLGTALALLCVAAPARAATISSCTENAVAQAVAAGGTYTFACDGDIVIAPPIAVSTTVVLDADGRDVVFSGSFGRVMEVRPGGDLTLRGIDVEDGTSRGTGGATGTSGTIGAGGGVGARGADGTAAQAGVAGTVGRGGCLLVEAGGRLVLRELTIRRCLAEGGRGGTGGQGGFGGRGGAGANGASGGAPGGSGGGGGDGRAGGDGAAGGPGRGGAIYSAGTLDVGTVHFEDNRAQGGMGGSGGRGGNAGGGGPGGGGGSPSGSANGGDAGTSGVPGSAGVGGFGGDGGAGNGGAIYALGAVSISGSHFARNAATGGATGIGGHGGHGGSALLGIPGRYTVSAPGEARCQYPGLSTTYYSQCGAFPPRSVASSGGNAGPNGDSGDGIGGAVFLEGPLPLPVNTTNDANRADAGEVPTECRGTQTQSFGCGIGGTGGLINDVTCLFTTPTCSEKAPDGANGAAGGVGRSQDPDVGSDQADGLRVVVRYTGDDVPSARLPLDEDVAGTVTVSVAATAPGPVTDIEFDAGGVLAEVGNDFVDLTVPAPPAKFTLAPGASRTFDVTIHARQRGTTALRSAASGKDTLGRTTEAADRKVVEIGEDLIDITVNEYGDKPNASSSTTDGRCDTETGINGEQCTLRAAIELANHRGPAKITFDLDGSADAIRPHAPLPAFKYSVDLRGDGAVVIDGTDAGDTPGLRIEGGSSVVTGLTVRKFEGDGIRIASSDNFVGKCTGFPCLSSNDNGGAGAAVASGTRNTISRSDLSGNDGPGIDLGDDGRTPNTGVPADFPVGVAEEHKATEFTLSGRAPTAPVGSKVEIFAQSGPGPEAQTEEMVAIAEVRETGWFGITDPGTTPATGRFFSATVTTPDGTTSELSAVCDDPDGDGEPDSDRDGLCDGWETNGYDYDDDGAADLQLPGADPARPDLYYEADAMQASQGYFAQPNAAVFDLVRSAFADAPIDIDVHFTGNAIDDAVPAQQEITAKGTTPNSLRGIRNGEATVACDGFFGTAAERSGPDCWKKIGAKRFTHRWILFGHTYKEDPGSSGVTPGVGGDSMMVSLSTWDDETLRSSGGGSSTCSGREGCRRNLEAATLMHEMGHTLGLDHGGPGDKLNFKPNYLSIMNYAFQFEQTVPGRPMDYSREKLQSIHEVSLIEPVGINAPPATVQRWPKTVIATLKQDDCKPGTPAKFKRIGVPTSGPIDYNQDGDTDDFADGRLVRGKCEIPQNMDGAEDWSALTYSFRSTEGSRAGSGPGSGDDDVNEITAAQVVQMAAETDIDGDGISNLAESCRVSPGSGFTDADGNGIADACEPAPPGPGPSGPGPSDPGGQGNANPPSGTGGAGGSPTPGDTLAPRFTTAKLKVSKIRRGRTSQLDFTLSEAAKVQVTITRLVDGRRSGKRCVTGRSKGKRCTIRRTVGKPLTVNGKLGKNTAIAIGKKLSAGRYVVTVTATDAAGNRAAPRSLNLRVIR